MNVARTRTPSRIAELLRLESWQSLAFFSSERTGCAVDPIRLAARCKSFKKVGNYCWSDATFIHWVLCRAVESAIDKHFADGTQDIRFSCKLHVFSIWIDETPEQVERLRNDNTERRLAQYARTKLTKMLSSRVRPIDSVAHSVAPFPCEDETGGGAA